MIAALATWQAERSADGYSPGEFVHAELFDKFQRGDAALASALHDANLSYLPYSAWPAGCDWIVAGLLSRPVVEVFRAGCPAAQIQDMTTLSDIWQEAETLATVQKERICLRFERPTCWRLNAQFHVLPEPELVFQGLKRLWETLEGPLLPEIDIDGIVCALINGQSRRVEFPRRGYWLAGFAGRAEYRISRLSEEEQQACIALARLAEFAGVGYHTGRGMGRVRLVGMR